MLFRGRVWGRLSADLPGVATDTQRVVQRLFRRNAVTIVPTPDWEAVRERD